MNNESGVNLSGLEIFFIITTVVSLVFNLLQWRDRRAFQGPLTNSMVAAFNDIKAKANSMYFVYHTLFNPNNPHKDTETLRWEYGLFAQAVLGYLQGFQEALVGVLVTLNPNDRKGRLAFRAADYGLTPGDKELRGRYLDQLREAAQRSSTPSDGPSADNEPGRGSAAEAADGPSPRPPGDSKDPK